MTLDAEAMRNSVRPGDVVVVEGEEFDLRRPVPVAAVYGPTDEHYFSGVTYGPEEIGELVDVSWDAIEAYHPREKTDDPRVISARLLEEHEEEIDAEELAAELEEVEER